MGMLMRRHRLAQQEARRKAAEAAKGGSPEPEHPEHPVPRKPPPVRKPPKPAS